MLTSVLGRKITHKKMTVDESLKFWHQFDLPSSYADFTAKMEDDASKGQEQAFFEVENKEVGKTHLWEYFRNPEVQKLFIKQ